MQDEKQLNQEKKKQNLNKKKKEYKKEKIRKSLKSKYLREVQAKIYQNVLHESPSNGIHIFGCWLSVDECQYSNDAGKIDMTLRYNRENSPGAFKGRVQMNIAFYDNFMSLNHKAIMISKLVITGDILDKDEFMGIMDNILKTITGLYSDTRTTYLRMANNTKKVPLYLKTLGFRRLSKGTDLLLHKPEKETNICKSILDKLLYKFLYKK